MEGGSILSMIAGFLPPSSDPPPSAPSSPPHRPSPTMSARSSTAADDSGSSCQTPADAAASRSAAPGRRLVHMICFSKDRAFQLDQLLASASRHLCLSQEGERQGGGEAGDDLVVPPVRLRVSVLYLATAGVAAGAAAAATVAPVPRATAAPAATTAAESPGEGGGRTRGSSSPHETMEESYDLIRRRYPNVRFLRERPGEFCTQLRSLVGEEWEESVAEGKGGHNEEVGEAFVLFAVDDMFFYRDFRLPDAVRLLATDPSVFCVHLRLHPGITWSHTAGSPCSVPPLSPTVGHVVQSQQGVDHGSGGADGIGTDSSSSSRRGNGGVGVCGLGGREEDHFAGDPIGTSDGSEAWPRPRRRRRHPPVVAAAEFGLLTFTRAQGTGEWDYPWDLTGGLYRREDAVAVLDGIVSAYGAGSAANPNLLEHHGHTLLLQQQRGLPQRKAVAGALPSRGDPETSSLPPATAESSCRLAVAAAAAAAASAATSAAPAAASTVSAAPRCGCSGRAVVSSLAVNRVQSTYSTPVYASREGGVLDLNRRLWSSARRPLPSSSRITTCDAADVAEAGQNTGPGAEMAEVEPARGERHDLENGGRQAEDAAAEPGGRCEQGQRRSGRGGGFDGRAYRRRVFNSVHVGELWFEGGGDSEEVGASCGGDDGGGSDGGKSGGGGGCTDQQQRKNQNTVTVLLPVKNGGDRLLEAVESVAACARRMPRGWCSELLIVDDGSRDGAVDRAVTAVTAGAGAAADFTGCVCRELDGSRQHPEGARRRAWDKERVIDGCRGGEGEKEPSEPDEGGVGHPESGTNDCCVDCDGSSGGGGSGVPDDARAVVRGEGRTPGFTVKVLRHDRTLGLAESLNEGLREATSNLVARMDADDVCMPGRLEQQVAFMLENPHVSVLGSSVATFSGESLRVGGERKRQQQPDTDDASARRHVPAAGVQRIARHPTDRALLAWSLLFGCCVAHPSVMLRRDRVIEAGGYDPATEPAEDYDLWLRLEALAPGCVANLGEVLLGLRKHEANVSRKRRQEQGEAADAAAARAMTRLLNSGGRRRRGGAPDRDVTTAQAAAIRRPECAASPGNLAEAARLLGDLGEAATAAVTGAGGAAGTDGVVVPSQVRDRGPDEDGSHNGRGRGHDGDDGADGDERRWQQREEEPMIASDVEARLGAMAVHAMSRFGEGAAPVLHEWKSRFPDRPLLFVLGGRGR
ncbi:unnamed protein product [Ectocarpus sp. 13 AM-2016]